MNIKLRVLTVFLVAFATLAPVCVLSGGDTKTRNESVELSDGALVEVIAENAEIQLKRVTGSTLQLSATLNNEEYVDFHTQKLTEEPVDHFIITATTSTGGAVTANSLIVIGIPDGIEIIIQTTNGALVADAINVSSADLATTDGKINLTNSSGDFDLNTTNSEITVQAVNGNINATTTNAHVWFEGVIASGNNSISTSNGDVAVRLRNGSDLVVTGSTHNGDVTINGSGNQEGLVKDGDSTTLDYQIAAGAGSLNITNGPGAIHINPDTIAVFDGDS